MKYILKYDGYEVTTYDNADFENLLDYLFGIGYYPAHTAFDTDSQCMTVECISPEQQTDSMKKARNEDMDY